MGALKTVNASAIVPACPGGPVVAITADWLGSIVKGTTRRSYTTALRQFLAWLGDQVVGEPFELGNVPVNVAAGKHSHSLSAKMVKRYLVHLQAEGLKAGSITQRLSVVRRWTRVLEEAGLVDPSRAAGIYHIKGQKRSRAMRSFLSDDEVQTLLDSIPTERLIDVRDRALLALLAWDGLRRAEVCSLRQGQYTIQNGHRIINHIERKGDTEHFVKIPVPLQRALELWWQRAELLTDDAPMFCAVDQFGVPSRQPLTSHAVYLIVRRRTQAAGFVGCTPHSMRRSFATNADRNGAPTSTIMAGGNWASRGMVDHYVQVRASLDRNAVDYLHYVL